MADLINLSSLFSDIVPDPAQEMRQQQSDLLSVLGTVGGAAALNAPRQNQQLRAASGGLFGVDTRTGSEKLREAMQGVDPNNPQDLIRLASMTDSIDPAKAIQLRQAAAQMTAQQNAQRQEALTLTQQRNAMMDIAVSIEDLDPAIQNAAVSGIEAGSYDGNMEGLIEALTPNKDRFDYKDGAVWDNLKGEWKVPPSEGADALGYSTIDPDSYTPESFVAYRRALAKANTPEERTNAQLYLKFKRPDNWEYTPVTTAEGNPVVDNNGIPKMIAKPTGSDLAEVTQQVRAANRGGQIILDKTGDVLETMNRVEDALESGTETGFGGAVLKYVAGTDTYTLGGDVDSILANLGYNSLQEARSSSANGASGFGQLTERELMDLKSLVDTLKIGMKPEDFKARFESIKKNFQRARNRAKTDWTVDQWIGVEQPPKGIEEGSEGMSTTPSGRTYSVEVVGGVQ